MNLLHRIKQLFKRKPPVWAKPCEDVIEFAFSAGGQNYFRFADPFRLPTHRAFAALAAYEALNYRCTREFLQAHTQAVEEALNQQKPIKVGMLNQILKERLE